MKKDTRAAKLAELLGIAPVIQQIVEKKSNTNKFVEVPEDKIEDFRAAQGLIYFLQAPELFTMKVCKHCKADFAVSRQFVNLCSYTCIKASLAEIGIDWNRNDTSDTEKIEMTINGIWEGQEPLWLKSDMLTRIKTVLNTLPDENLSSTSSSQQDNSLSMAP